MSLTEKHKAAMELANKGFNKEMNLKLIDVGDNGLEMEMPVEDKFLNHMGAVHGGIIFSFVDSSGGYTARIFNERTVVTQSCSINFVRPGVNTEKLVSRTRIIKSGATVCVVNIAIYDDKDTQIADATGTYFYVSRK